MVTSAIIYHLMNWLHVSIDVRNVCVFLAPLFSSLTTLVTYLLAKELKDTGAGLVAAAMISIVPGYISRSVAGSYDNEGIAIFCMLLTYWLWIKAVKSGSLLWSALCSLAYFYMVSHLICLNPSAPVWIHPNQSLPVLPVLNFDSKLIKWPSFFYRLFLHSSSSRGLDSSWTFLM